MDQITAYLSDYAQLAFDYLRQPAILIQLGIIAIAFPVAWLLARPVKPALEESARKIERFPGVRRVLLGFLRRFEWLFFIILLALTYLATQLVSWPDSNYLIYAALQLSGAWLVIGVLSLTIRNGGVRKVFAWIAWLYAAALVFGIVDDVSALLDGAGFNIGSFRLSLLIAIKAAVLVGATLWVAIATGNFVDQRIKSMDELTPSLRVLLGKVVRISLIVIAALVAISSLGIDLSALTLLSGAIGVGLGFGLQKVVSNFISGIIILMDRSIKPGDTIELGQTFGWIRELRARFVSVITRDGREYLIPNEDFITTQVINWSFSDQYVRLDVPFGVSYDSDPHEVTRLAIEAASSVDRVVANYKKPVCWMTEFGDSSINFLLRFWIVDPQEGLTNIRGKVLMALWDTFKENGIKIPYPHREVIMKAPVTVQTEHQ